MASKVIGRTAVGKNIYYGTAADLAALSGAVNGDIFIEVDGTKYQFNGSAWSAISSVGMQWDSIGDMKDIQSADLLRLFGLDALKSDANGNPVYNLGVLQATLLQTGLPFVLQSSGSVGNNGALSGIVALPAAYTQCYMYFPANAIYAGSTAGWYYVVMPSTSAGTIYNNTYASGTPVVPSAPTPFVTTGPGAYMQVSGAAVTALSVTVPGGSMGPHGRVVMNLMGSSANNASNKLVEVYLGGQAIMSQTFAAYNTFRFVGEVQNLAVDHQIGSFYAGIGAVAVDWLRRSVNTAVDQALAATLRLTNAATDFVILEGVTAAIYYGA